MGLTRFARHLHAGWIVGAVVASIAWSVSWAPRPAPSAQVGSLEGQVLLSPRIASRRPRFRLYTEYGQGAVVPPAVTVDTNEMANVTIYLDSAGSDGAEVVEGAHQMRQVNEAFSPHVLTVVVGSTVEFPNKDPFFHNVFSLSKVRTFDLGRYQQDASKSVKFDRPGMVQVFCHIHSDMSAVVLVVPNRFFTSPGSRGSYAIRGIPPGTYRVTAWHERAKPIAATARIRADQATQLDFNIPIADGESSHH